MVEKKPALIASKWCFFQSFPLADSHFIPSRPSPVKGRSAKTIADQTASIVVKREPDSDDLLRTPTRGAAKSKGKRPQCYSTPIEISDSEPESDAPTP